MEEYVDRINQYLPVKFSDVENEEFRNYLISGYKSNLIENKQQLSLICFHMLFMSYIYSQFWILKKVDYNCVSRFISGNNKLDCIKIFDYSEVDEKTVITTLMRSIGFHGNASDELTSYVEKRNHCAHASGFIQYELNDIEEFCEKELQYCKKINEKIKEKLILSLLNEIVAFFDSKEYNKISSYSFIERTIKENIFSEMNLEYLVNNIFQLIKIDNKDYIKTYKKISMIIFYVVISKKIDQYNENIFFEKLQEVIDEYSQYSSEYFLNCEEVLYDEINEISNNIFDIGKLEKVTNKIFKE